MPQKLAGLGLKNLILVTFFVIIAIVVLKTILTKHPVKGVSEDTIIFKCIFDNGLHLYY